MGVVAWIFPDLASGLAASAALTGNLICWSAICVEPR
jgi:hypothetical protein